MEIHVKQTEIEAALRQYLTNQGTNLTGRAVSIVFTSGRNPSGLTAAIDIGDVTERAPQVPLVDRRLADATVGTAGEIPAKVEEQVHTPELVPDDAHAPLSDPVVPVNQPEETPVSLFS